MSGIKIIALAGAGNIGASIANELLKAKAAGRLNGVVILARARPASTVISEFIKQGAKVLEVDYSNAASLESALKGVDTVISTIGRAGIADAQIALASAAKKAGVRLFVPSEYGNSDEGRGKEYHLALKAKTEFYNHLKEIELPWVKFFTGVWVDFSLPFVGVNFKSGKVTVAGDGNTPVTCTFVADAARFIAHALTEFSLEDLEYKAIRMEGARKTFNELVQIYEKRHNTKIEVTYVPTETLRAQAAELGNVIAALRLEWATGRGVVGEPLDNAKWPEWNPTRLEDAL